ncbi:unnamed protein product [Nyctereutes procyonoides]|uniref:(raccoon dog) hypothetical protein n=1 Tax=Nyctereutes procyonoides TaxID=34880 RepID=A0A811YYW8_NYCPR|nr:unnamed protein product [Nyctereutes procyonoides]
MGPLLCIGKMEPSGPEQHCENQRNLLHFDQQAPGPMVLGLHTCCLSKRPWICPPGRSLEAKEPVGSLCYLSKSPPGSPKNSSHSLLRLRLQSRWPLTPKGPSTQLTDLDPFLSFKPITEKEATDHPPLPRSPHPPNPPVLREHSSEAPVLILCTTEQDPSLGSHITPQARESYDGRWHRKSLPRGCILFRTRWLPSKRVQ